MKRFLIPPTIFAVIALLICLLPSPAQAKLEPSPWTKEKLYMDKISHKAGYGILNMGTGWMAFLFEPRHKGLKGFGTGLVYALTNTAGGMLHVATFPLPVDLPLPNGGIAYEYEQ